MAPKVVIIYNQPVQQSYTNTAEAKSAKAITESAEAVSSALIDLGYPVELTPLGPPLESVADKLNKLQADVVFNLFEGFDDWPESESAIADILSENGLRYTGCTGSTLLLALDKVRSKALMEVSQIDSPKYQVLNPQILSQGISEDSVIFDNIALEIKVTEISHRFGGKAMVEEYAEGREFNITILGNKELTILPISEIEYTLPPDVPKILTLSAKWDPESLYFQNTNPVCPAHVDNGLKECIEDTAIKLFRIFDCTGYARVDFRLDTEGKLNALELNPNPDISPNSGAALQARVADIPYGKFLEKILLLALETRAVR
jgi:D-alanine-D-alanine ligase